MRRQRARGIKVGVVVVDLQTRGFSAFYGSSSQTLASSESPGELVKRDCGGSSSEVPVQRFNTLPGL